MQWNRLWYPWRQNQVSGQDVLGLRGYLRWPSVICRWDNCSTVFWQHIVGSVLPMLLECLGDLKERHYSRLWLCRHVCFLCNCRTHLWLTRGLNDFHTWATWLEKLDCEKEKTRQSRYFRLKRLSNKFYNFHSLWIKFPHPSYSDCGGLVIKFAS